MSLLCPVSLLALTFNKLQLPSFKQSVLLWKDLFDEEAKQKSPASHLEIVDSSGKAGLGVCPPPSRPAPDWGRVAEREEVGTYLPVSPVTGLRSAQESVPRSPDPQLLHPLARPKPCLAENQPGSLTRWGCRMFSLTTLQRGALSYSEIQRGAIDIHFGSNPILIIGESGLFR